MIETTRLSLRRPTNEDIFMLENLWRDEKVREFLGGTITDEAIRQKIVALQTHWDSHQFGQLVVREKNATEVAGLCGLHYSEDGVEISYMFFPKFWGKGFAGEAVWATIDYGFSTLKLDTIITITQEINIKSCQLLDKIGMDHINTFVRFNATQRLYRLIRTEWHNNVRSV